MERKKGFSLAKGPVGIIGAVLLAGGILGLLMGSTDLTTDAPNGDVTGGTFFGIEGNGWTWLLFAGAGLILLLSAPMHWGAKTMAMLVGLAMAAAAVIALADGSDVFGVFATNGATILAFGAAAVALIVAAMLPRVGKRRREEVVVDRRDRRFDRDETRVDEPVGTRRRA
jgi:hypothetical protein